MEDSEVSLMTMQKLMFLDGIAKNAQKLVGASGTMEFWEV